MHLQHPFHHLPRLPAATNAPCSNSCCTLMLCQRPPLPSTYTPATPKTRAIAAACTPLTLLLFPFVPGFHVFVASCPPAPISFMLLLLHSCSLTFLLLFARPPLFPSCSCSFVPGLDVFVASCTPIACFLHAPTCPFALLPPFPSCSCFCVPGP